MGPMGRGVGEKSETARARPIQEKVRWSNKILDMFSALEIYNLNFTFKSEGSLEASAIYIVLLLFLLFLLLSLLVNRKGIVGCIYSTLGISYLYDKRGNWIQGRKELVRQRFAAYKVKNFFNRYEDCVKYIISLFMNIVNVCIIPQYANTLNNVIFKGNKWRGCIQRFWKVKYNCLNNLPIKYLHFVSFVICLIKILETVTEIRF
jgi:hypothetical protein